MSDWTKKNFGTLVLVPIYLKQLVLIVSSEKSQFLLKHFKTGIMFICGMPENQLVVAKCIDHYEHSTFNIQHLTVIVPDA